MKPETAGYLEKSKEQLAKAPALLHAGFPDDSGRVAYLAGFHAAQALIFEKLGRTAKTHSGVQAQFAKLAKERRELDAELRSFLGYAYQLKAIADYETGPGSHVTRERAARAIATAQRFIAMVEVLIAEAGAEQG